jgi:sulfur carrier protein ThiS adenylyltransferase
MNVKQINERFKRQRDIVPADRLADCKVTIIGIGSIGRQVALQLAAMGVSWMQLIDFEIVESSNLASQGYFEEDLNKLKIDATLGLCSKLNTSMLIQSIPERFRRSMRIGNVVFSCVDKIETRQLIWQAIKDNVKCLVDGRMTAEVLRILTASDAESRQYYPNTFFSADQAFVGPCTAKTTIYCANIAAGLMIAQFTKYLRQLPIEPDVQLNLLTSELYVTETG